MTAPEPIHGGDKLRTSVYLPVLQAGTFGFAAGAAAVALSLGVDALGTWRVQLATKDSAMMVLPAFGFIGGTIAGLLVQRVAPQASGSGIPQVRAALDRLRMPLDWRIALVKLVGGTVALGSGLFMGREGPTVQLGAALASTLGQWAPGAQRYRRQLIAAGAGAGLAAAFNAPIAGAMFVLEELLREMKPTTVVIALTASSTATLALTTLWPPSPHTVAHLASEQIAFRMEDLPFYVMLALACAFMSWAFNNGILFSLNLYSRIKCLPMALKVGMAGLASGLIIACCPPAFENYAAMRGLIISGAESWQTVTFALFEFYFLSLLAYGSGAPGGLFAPSLAIGACIGYLIGLLDAMVLPGASPCTFALVGMGALFASVARVPMTATIITFELTGNFTVLTPLMVTCVLASAMGERISPNSLYERLMDWNGLHLRQEPDADSTRFDLIQTTVRQLYETDVDSVASSTRVTELPAIIARQRHQGMPVVDKGKLVGVVSQTFLATLMHPELVDENLTVAQVMMLHPVAVSPAETIDEILHLFTHHHYSWLPVTEGDRFCGVIYQNDVIKALFSSSFETQQHAAPTVEKAVETVQEVGSRDS